MDGRFPVSTWLSSSCTLHHHYLKQGLVWFGLVWFGFLNPLNLPTSLSTRESFAVASATLQKQQTDLIASIHIYEPQPSLILQRQKAQSYQKRNQHAKFNSSYKHEHHGNQRSSSSRARSFPRILSLLLTLDIHFEFHILLELLPGVKHYPLPHTLQIIDANPHIPKHEKPKDERGESCGAMGKERCEGMETTLCQIPHAKESTSSRSAASFRVEWY